MGYSLWLSKLLIRTGLSRWLPSLRRLSEDGGSFLHYYSDRVLSAPYAELRQAGAFHQQCGPDTIDLTLAAPQFDLVPPVGSRVLADRRGWPPPWGLFELRQAIAEALEPNLAVRPEDEVLVTQGVAGAFSLVLDTFLNPGDRIVLFDPSSPLYALAARHRGAAVRWVPTWMEEGKTRFRLAHLAAAVRGARLLVVTTPNNPTGGAFTPGDLEAIAWWADRHDVLLVQDTVYERYSYERDVSYLAQIPKAARRVLTAGSLSKGHALAAARVGWLAGHRQLVRPCTLNAVLQAAMIPTVCQQIALAALRQPLADFRPHRDAFRVRRQETYDRLWAIGFEPPWPAGGFFFWVPVGSTGFTGRVFAERLLRAKQVLVTPGDLFGPSGTGFVRLSYAGDDGRIREGLNRLGEFVRELNGVPGRLARLAA